MILHVLLSTSEIFLIFDFLSRIAFIQVDTKFASGVCFIPRNHYKLAVIFMDLILRDPLFRIGNKCVGPILLELIYAKRINHVN